SGVIARADVTVGQVVAPNDVLFDVVDPSRMLVEAVTADPALAASVGAASLQGVPEARLQFVGGAQMLRDGVLPLIFTVAPGAPLPLAIGQPVTVIAQSNQRVKGIVLPAQAVVRNATNEPIVWIKSGAERFIAQPVRLQPLDASTVVITQGLGADNRVVVQGAPLIAQIR
ncbi:HlyD family efflux transporter periplasmic adaptor subunit, partial [Thauera sp.]